MRVEWTCGKNNKTSFAWPDLSSAQGIIAFNISTHAKDFSAAAYTEAVTPCAEENSGHVTLQWNVNKNIQWFVGNL